MLPRPLLLPILASGALLGAGESTPQGAFSYSGSDLRGNSTMRRSMDEAEKAFFQVTGFLPSDAPPVLLSTRERGVPPTLSVNALESSRPEIRLVLPRDPEDSLIPPFLATALLLRQYYGKTPPVPGSAVPRYPDWLTRGLGALILGQPANDAEVSPGPELEAFLTERVPDPANVSLLRHYDDLASVLVRAGLSDEDGRKAFREWIGRYDPSVEPRPVSSWVGAWEMRRVERRWVLGLHVPQEKEQLPIRIRSAASTLQQYDLIMREGLSGKASLAELAGERGGAFRLKIIEEKLSSLRLQANPLAFPLVDRAILLVDAANRTSSKKMAEAEKRLKDSYLSLVKQSRAIEDYLDWYEAARVTIPSGLFERYLSIPTSAACKGPIGRHLDAVQARGW